MMNLLEKMQEMTESLNAEELLANRDKEEEKETYRGFGLVKRDNGYEAKENDKITIWASKEQIFEAIDEHIDIELRAYINKLGYADKFDTDRFKHYFDNEEELNEAVARISEEETYQAKLRYKRGFAWDCWDKEDVEEDEERWRVTRKELTWLGGKIINDDRVSILAVGDKQLDELKMIRHLADDKMNVGEIEVMYGPESDWYEPVKNGNVIRV